MLQWHDPITDKRKSKSTETCNPLDAETKRADLEYELNNGLHQEPVRLSWEAFRKLFEDEYLSGLRPRTRKKHAAVFDLFEQLPRPGQLSAIDERTLSTFVGALRKHEHRSKVGLMASSIRCYLDVLHAALEWARQQKLLRELPRFPEVKVPRKKPQPIPAESFQRLLAKAPDRQTQTFLLSGWLGGLRLGECLALEWQRAEDAPWLDLDADRIRFPAEFVKSDEDQWVPLDPDLREALLALRRRGKKVFQFTARGGGPIGITAVSERIIALARQAGVRLTMHSLRKGFGCRHAGRVPAQVLQRLMRHGNIKTTMDFYANVDEAVEEAIKGPRRNAGRNKTDKISTDCLSLDAGTPDFSGEQGR